MCKFFSFTFVLLLICISATYAEDTPAAEPCPFRYKCSLQEDVVWATDAKNCQVFRNSCHLDNENCHRQNRYEEVLNTVPKEECQKLCPEMCTDDYTPVCAEYNEIKKTFSNKCQLAVHICKSGETYDLPVLGEC